MAQCSPTYAVRERTIGANQQVIVRQQGFKRTRYERREGLRPEDSIRKRGARAGAELGKSVRTSLIDPVCPSRPIEV